MYNSVERQYIGKNLENVFLTFFGLKQNEKEKN
jgi:hypothetical protein